MKKFIISTFALLLTLAAIVPANAAKLGYPTYTAKLGYPTYTAKLGYQGENPKTAIIPATSNADAYCIILKEVHEAFDDKKAGEYINKLAKEQKENEAKAKNAKTKKEKEEAAKEALDLEVKAQLINVIAKNVSDQVALDVIGRKKTQAEQATAEKEHNEAQDVADAAKVTAKTAIKAVTK